MSDHSAFRSLCAAAAALVLSALPVFALDPQETPYFADKVASGDLPPIAERLPDTPLVVDLEAKGRTTGVQGGTLRTMVSRSKDVRQMVVYGYARLIGYNEDYELVPDILQSFDNQDDKVFTFHLRPGMKWSDGAPFTSDDFAYWWNDVANNEELSPSGPPDFLRVNGKFPTVTFPDAYTVVYAWDDPNPAFLAYFAQAVPPFIYRPKHYTSQFHANYVTPEKLEEIVDENRLRSWAALHNKIDNMHRFDNPDLPTLQPWVNVSDGKQTRHMFVRNPYFHRIDSKGQQLPYIDEVEMTIVSGGLIAAKSNAGESDLQGRGLDFPDIAILRKGEADGGNYKTYLWGNGYASQIAIYPNLNYNDTAWRDVLRDVRVRRALSLGINRNAINQALYFKLAKPGAMTVLPRSPFYNEANRDAWAAHDIDQANALLDEAGLDKRQGDGIRLLPDGRPMEIVIETAGERQEVENALQIIIDNWRDIGVKLIMRPLDRDILYNRVFAGTTMAAVWYGWDDGLPQAYTSPSYVCPRRQEFFAWPKWGQYYQTNGESGEPPDMEPAIRLMELCKDWDQAKTDEERGAIWSEMLKIHADNVFGIGILAEAPQPIVVNKRLRNVPEKAIWAWDPGAHFGIYHPDEFYFADAP
ncbi:MAG: peptide ABC transporter substrate-binding protein [Rhodobacteraceae bacterium]|nr:peptide ABC transporter substrate-binding protein [Paracoccaceae bacterium]MAY45447.1 peptide ABC transporter substrate-binding protein [Paracoccaceae bacterium]